MFRAFEKKKAHTHTQESNHVWGEPHRQEGNSELPPRNIKQSGSGVFGKKVKKKGETKRGVGLDFLLYASLFALPNVKSIVEPRIASALVFVLVKLQDAGGGDHIEKLKHLWPKYKQSFS